MLLSMSHLNCYLDSNVPPYLDDTDLGDIPEYFDDDLADLLFEPPDVVVDEVRLVQLINDDFVADQSF